MQDTVSHKVAVIFGTRPEAIKLIPVINALKNRSNVEVRVIVTGQHREILHQMLRLYEVVPDIDLDLMTHNQTLGQLTAKAIHALDNSFSNDNYGAG